jgi:hypothetical protein
VRVAAVILLLTIGLVGCGPPPAVRSLSQEQLRVQEAFAVSLEAYSNTMTEFAEVQVELSLLWIELEVMDREVLHKEDASDLLDALDVLQEDPASELDRALLRLCPELEADRADHTFEQCRQEILGELAQRVREDAARYQANRVSMNATIQRLKESQQALRDVYEDIVEAQRALNTYIQLERADEIVVNELLGVVGLNQERVRQSIDVIGEIMSEIRSFMPAPAEQPSGTGGG